MLHGSYGAEFGKIWGRKVRDLAEKNAPRLTFEIKQDTMAANHWETTEGGGMSTAGVGGPFTGKGANVLIVDDPVKDKEEADSEVMRAKVVEWFKTVALTRLEPDATAILIMTRWHEADLVGALKAEEKELAKQGVPYDEWTVINFPAIAEEGDAIGRETGEPLWPERYPIERLEVIRSRQGSRNWNALYQQRPSPAGGSIFKRKSFRYFREEQDWFELYPEGLEAGVVKRVHKQRVWYCITADTALEEKKEADYTAFGAFAVCPDGEVLLLEAYRDRLDIPDQWGAFQTFRSRYQRLNGYRWAGVEDKVSGKAIIQLAKKRHVPVVPLQPETDKVTRAAEASVHYENLMVYHRAEALWLDDLEHELLSFPNGANDDQVDTISYAIREVVRSVGGVADEAPPKTEDSRTDLSRLDGYQPAGAGLDDW